MKIKTWYKADEYQDGHYNCILLKDNISHGASTPSYHAMIKDGKIIQVMSGFTRVDDSEIWQPLSNTEMEKILENWVTFIEAKQSLLGLRKVVVASVENDKLKKVWS